MPDNQATVTVKVDVPQGDWFNAPQRQANAQAYREMMEARRAAGRGAMEDIAAPSFGGMLPSADRIDRLMQHLARWKFSEQQINELIAQRKKDLESIGQNLITAKNRGLYEGLVRGGVSPMAAVQQLAQMGQINPQDLAEARRRGLHYEQQLQRLGQYREDMREGLYDAHDRALGKWIPQLGNMLTSTLRILGIGGAIATMAEARRNAIEYNIAAADIRGFVGRRG